LSKNILKIFSDWGYDCRVFNNSVIGQVLNIIKKAALFLARKKYCKDAIEQRADLSAMREKPARQVIAGLILVAFSYVIGLPAVVFLSVCAVKLDRPLIVVVGGSLIYGVSTIIFLIGIRLAGKKYFHVFCRWAVRVVLEKILGDDIRVLSESVSDGPFPDTTC